MLGICPTRVAAMRSGVRPLSLGTRTGFACGDLRCAYWRAAYRSTTVLVVTSCGRRTYFRGARLWEEDAYFWIANAVTNLARAQHMVRAAHRGDAALSAGGASHLAAWRLVLRKGPRATAFSTPVAGMLLPGGVASALKGVQEDRPTAVWFALVSKDAVVILLYFLPCPAKLWRGKRWTVTGCGHRLARRAPPAARAAAASGPLVLKPSTRLDPAWRYVSPTELGEANTTSVATVLFWRTLIGTALTPLRRAPTDASAGSSTPPLQVFFAYGAAPPQAAPTTAAPTPGLASFGTDPKILSTSTITASIAVGIAADITTGCVLWDWTNGRCRVSDPANRRACRLLPPIVIVTIKMVSGSVWMENDVTSVTTGGGGGGR